MITDIRFRAEGNLVVLQVEVSEPERYSPYNTIAVWRDAKVEDLLEASKFCRTDLTDRIENVSQRVSDMSYSINHVLSHIHNQKSGDQQ